MLLYVLCFLAGLHSGQLCPAVVCLCAVRTDDVDWGLESLVHCSAGGFLGS